MEGQTKTIIVHCAFVPNGSKWDDICNKQAAIVRRFGTGRGCTGTRNPVPPGFPASMVLFMYIYAPILIFHVWLFLDDAVFVALECGLDSSLVDGYSLLLAMSHLSIKQ